MPISLCHYFINAGFPQLSLPSLTFLGSFIFMECFRYLVSSTYTVHVSVNTHIHTHILLKLMLFEVAQLFTKMQ